MPAVQTQAGAALTAASAPAVYLRRWRWAGLGLAAVTIVLDQGTKLWALRALTPGEPKDLIGEAIRLNLIRNPGAAFSMGHGMTWVLTAVALAITAWLAHALWTTTSRPWANTLGVLLGGAVGNLIDRAVRSPGPGRGHVVDFLDYFGLFVGNVADIAIVLAAAGMAWLALRGVPVRAHIEEVHHE